MDNSRVHDMFLLKQRFNSSSVPHFFRMQAGRSYNRIKGQLHDDTIRHLRYRLIRAHTKEDVKQIENISDRLRYYELRNYRSA